MRTAGRKGEFTGRHMLAIMVCFFGVIISVNLTMAYMARKSWTGFVAQNTYVASIDFNAQAAAARAQEALGWSSELGMEGGILTYRLADAEGRPVAADLAQAYFRHPAYDADDRQAVLARQPDGSFVTDMALPDGQWIIEIDTPAAGLERPYRDVTRVVVREGTIR